MVKKGLKIDDVSKEFEKDGKHAKWHGTWSKGFIEHLRKSEIKIPKEFPKKVSGIISEEDLEKNVVNNAVKSVNIVEDVLIQTVKKVESIPVVRIEAQNDLVIKKVDVKKIEESKQNLVSTVVSVPKSVVVKPFEDVEVFDEDTLAKIFKQSDFTLWEEADKVQQEKLAKGEKLVKGFWTIVSGETKSGKTKFGLSASEFEGLVGNKRIIPRGNPVFCIVFNQEAEDEAIRKFPNLVYKEIKFVNCYVEDPETGLIDARKSIAKAMRYIFGLKNQKEGTLYIDNYSLFCALMMFTFLQTATVKDEVTGRQRPLKWNDFTQPEKRIMIYDYQFNDRTMTFFALKLQTFTINIIFGVQVKPKYETKKGEAMGTATGEMIENFQKGTDQYADIIARLVKYEDNNFLKRKMKITKSRFEGKEVSLDFVTLEAPDFKDLMNKIIKNYL